MKKTKDKPYNNGYICFKHGVAYFSNALHVHLKNQLKNEQSVETAT